MRIELSAASPPLLALAVAQPVESQPLPRRAGPDLCRSRRPRRRPRRSPPMSASRTPSALGARRRRTSRRATPVPGRGRCRRADSRRRADSPARVSYLVDLPNDSRGRPARAAAARRDVWSSPSACRIGRRAAPRRARRPAPLRAGDGRAAARDPARGERRRRAAANHRHRPRLPRPRLAARRKRDPDLPADRRRPADLARPSCAGRARRRAGRWR